MNHPRIFFQCNHVSGLPKNAGADVIPVFEISPTKFFCQKVESQSELEALMGEIANTYPGSVPSLSSCQPGSMCCALYSADGSWYRAVLEENLGSTLKVY